VVSLVGLVAGTLGGALGGEVVMIVFPTSDRLLLVFFVCERGGLLVLGVFGVLGSGISFSYIEPAEDKDERPLSSSSLSPYAFLVARGFPGLRMTLCFVRTCWSYSS
jgi:hypothetical protein